MKMNIILLATLSLFSACGGGDEEESTIPTNLQVTIEISTETPGLVNVTATAENAKYYTMAFGEGSSVTSTDGKATYTYQYSGTYTLVVQAHNNPTSFISDTQQITVSVPDLFEIPTEGYSTPETYEGYTLVWQDEFSGSVLNPDFWSFEIGTGSNGWGNNELQYYREQNTSFKDGFLAITARNESFAGSNYTSSRIVTKGKKEFKYGRVDIRATLPKGQGIWPALWMLGGNIGAVGWPKCGEIDVMEMIGGNGRESTVYGTLHWDESGHVCTCDKPGYTLTSGTFADKFHVFTLEWDETNIKWYVDDVLFNTINITPAGLSEFHENYFFIFNLAVGGNWPGNPNQFTVFPQRLIVDYIRVFQKQ